MRLFVLACLCVAAGLLSAGAAQAANDGSIRIADWILRPHFSEQKDKKQKEKRLERCTAQLTNADKITMIYSLDTHYMWTFELSNPSWNFPSGSKFDVSFGNRERGFFRQRVAALEHHGRDLFGAQAVDAERRQRGQANGRRARLSLQLGRFGTQRHFVRGVERRVERGPLRSGVEHELEHADSFYVDGDGGMARLGDRQCHFGAQRSAEPQSGNREI